MKLESGAVNHEVDHTRLGLFNQGNLMLPPLHTPFSPLTVIFSLVYVTSASPFLSGSMGVH